MTWTPEKFDRELAITRGERDEWQALAKHLADALREVDPWHEALVDTRLIEATA